MYGDMELYEFLKVYKGYSFYDFVVPLWHYIGKMDIYKELVNIWKGNVGQPLHVKGFKGNDLAWTDDLLKARMSNESYNPKIDTPSIALFEQFIQECKSDNIALYLVYASEHVDGQAYIANRKEIKEVLESIIQKYQLSYLYYTNDPICNDTTYFYNSMHLNAKGS